MSSGGLFHKARARTENGCILAAVDFAYCRVPLAEVPAEMSKAAMAEHSGRHEGPRSMNGCVSGQYLELNLVTVRQLRQ